MKYDLVNAMNPMWRDLAEDLEFDPLSLEKRPFPGQARDGEGGARDNGGEQQLFTPVSDIR